MAGRNFSDSQALEREVKTLFAEVAIAASGAPTLSRGWGVASVTRTDTGDYTVVLEDKYNRLFNVDIQYLHSTDADLTFQLKTDTVSTDKTFTFTAKAAATPADPANGSQLRLAIHVKNTSQGE